MTEIQRIEGPHGRLAETERKLKEMTELARDLALVVEDFMPNVGRCALQNYKRLNDSMFKARQLGLTTAK